jgi:hypothetical protein
VQLCENDVPSYAGKAPLGRLRNYTVCALCSVQASCLPEPLLIISPASRFFPGLHWPGVGTSYEVWFSGSEEVLGSSVQRTRSLVLGTVFSPQLVSGVGWSGRALGGDVGGEDDCVHPTAGSPWAQVGVGWPDRVFLTVRDTGRRIGPC